jgi:acetaldehyde dehydrogenase/alcohol dehydrogenase
MWIFSAPEVVFGEDALSRLGELKGTRAYIVTDANMVALGFVARVEEYLSAAGMVCDWFAEVEPDPSIQTVERCITSLTAFGPDVVIGLGGGSCLDAAKTAWFRYERPDVPLEEINPFERFEMPGKARLVAIPTTSGTGADATIGVVLSDSEAGRKIVVYARELQPHLTLVDPSFVVGLPKGITADTGMDVLSHAIEAYASPWHNDFADGLALKAVQLVFEYLPRAYGDGSDIEARERMHNAATLAGMALSNASISLAHAMAHAFGAIFHTPHGRTVGLFLPYTIEYTANGGGSRYGEIARWLGLAATDEATGAASLVAKIRELARELGQPITIRDLDIDSMGLEAVMAELVDKAAEDPQIITSLRAPDNGELANLFRYAFDGRRVDW